MKLILSLCALAAISTFGNAMDCDRLRSFVSDVYECPSSGECIFGEWVCDSKPDCVDKSDEDTETCKEKWKNSCSNDFIGEPFVCDNKMCVPPSSACDGVSDCLDGSDEVNCSDSEYSWSSY